jgi:hypothetical protein
MPIHGSRMLPGSERITSDIRSLIGAFDPAKPVTYDIEFTSLPKVKWVGSYKELEVTVEESGGWRAVSFWGEGGGWVVLPALSE